MKINDPFWNTWCEVTMVGSEVLMISVIILRNLRRSVQQWQFPLKFKSKLCMHRLLITLIITRFNV